ncbi:GNAT family N-acetyltransferase [Nonomuraea sp. M3C6]|uniref:GNAT family N-acetyltransferase n=1 Tax=Nonomuraea marmarensis TaxID=3351344 RepID=A0ABW7AVL0_9ACTN
MQQWSINGPLRAFAIHVDTQTDLVGTIDLRFEAEDLAEGQVRIAYGLYPKWRGRGLATRAVHLVCLYAAAQGATQAVINVEPENAASVAVAQRSSFRYVTQFRDSGGTKLSRHHCGWALHARPHRHELQGERRLWPVSRPQPCRVGVDGRHWLSQTIGHSPVPVRARVALGTKCPQLTKRDHGA